MKNGLLDCEFTNINKCQIVQYVNDMTAYIIHKTNYLSMFYIFCVWSVSCDVKGSNVFVVTPNNKFKKKNIDAKKDGDKIDV